jgi:hypothetical protein
MEKAHQDENHSPMSQLPFSPREFLKKRRPEKFSDSVSHNVPTLDRSLLEYHLQSLTSRSQETDFELFARRLAEVEICPNLLPHTGPTGGGDSKVDAETYPVADSLSLIWYTGIGREAAKERWAFAFSAQKTWRPKVESDVAKIVATNRGYQKVFFVTNQFVSDKKRAEVEDKLGQKHGADVRILDRTWILDRVFSNKREALAIDELKITTEVRVQRRTGPLDLQKEEELQELEALIQRAVREGRKSPGLIDDCLRAVELARGLELPRTDIEGRLVRLKRVAEECGTPHQRLLAEYAWAWTAFFWFEDYSVFLDHYLEAEKRASGTTNVYELELLFNLWCNLQMAVHRANISSDAANLPERTKILTTPLDRMQHEEERPSSALQAETLLLLMALIQSSPEQAHDWFRKATSVIDRSAGLVGFPFEPLVQILTELAKVLGDRAGYDALYDKLISAVAERSGEAAAARLLIQRAAQALDDEQPYIAIQAAGKAIARLYQHETRHELIEALYICGNAYDRVGLVWAARGSVLTAASVAINEFWTHDKITVEQTMCFDSLRWLELRLGRLPHSLAWHETTQTVESALRAKGHDFERGLQQLIWFDICLAILLLKADLWQLGQLSRLPNVLDRLELNLSGAALRFALGHDYKLPEGLAVKEHEREEFIHQLRGQPAAEQLPSLPFLCNERRITLSSRILGCSITVNADNRSPSMELAESVLAALEALLATGMEHRFFAHEPHLNIDIRISDFATYPFRFDFTEKGGQPTIEIAVAAFHPHKLNPTLQNQLRDKLTELLVNIIARFFVIDISEEKLKEFFGEERALDRAVNFTGSFVSVGNVLGYTPKTTLDPWVDSKEKEYALKRSEDWDADERSQIADSKATPARGDTALRGSGDEWRRSTGHHQMEMVSLIRLSLWDKAKWVGTGYLCDATNQSPPAIGLAFTDADSGREIFAHWRKELGTTDKKERLRLTIIRGIDAKNPHAYRVLITANPEMSGLKDDLSKLMFMVSRINTMTPSSDSNLRAFLDNYRAVGHYLLVPALFRGPSVPPELFYDYGILKRDIQVRDAWQIGPNDPDTMALRDDDDPIIPAGEHDAPVIRALKWLRENSRDGGR